ncbi:LPXTG-motif cell wall-anchored protein/uncharacterized repeat protein (TIGR02543 family) [Aurantimicrobium minutum]|uniref:InlB B-repeat-containing protein n=1 Tax=Aurantimicrobium minutum TaxID=708131 RepID=UPI002476EBA8|nr:InlB B-repeat-containing protein [Aurantimicrobium minutum]MDH6277186.1 LPXTG-motif cell wall-anchored protein/uncharacterized repeat protein (TIGR02543 family) [Aurantimicrobium minutum]
MKKFSLKALGASVLALGLVVAGFAFPASAATLAATFVTNPAGAPLSPSTATPAFSVTVPGAAISSNLQYIDIGASRNGQNWVPKATCPSYANANADAQNQTDCGISSITIGGTTVTGWKIYTGGLMYNGIRLYKTGLSSATADIVINFTAASWTTGSANGNYTFTVKTQQNSGTEIDIANATVLVGTASATVTFMRNDGVGSMQQQSASTATNLTPNAFTLSGYTFAGWNTAANGSGTAYANSASYPFAADVNLYAQWTVNGGGGSSSSTPEALANTGIDSSSAILLLAGGLSLALVGAEMFIIARRKRSN